MKRFLTIVIGCLLLAPTGLASAHVLKEDHGIAAILHIPPDDNPVAGKVTELDFSFGDDAQTFTLQHCRCQAMVRQGGEVIQQTPLKPAVPDAPLDGLAMVKFPKTGAYDVIMSGQPTDRSFPTFSLDYTVRVATGVGTDNKAAQGSEVLIIGAGSLAILALFAYNNIAAGGRYAAKPPPRRGTLKT